MSTTVNSHQLAAFTTPINNTSPIDANQVRGNDNTTGTTYNAHDADPGIHVQSSVLASRPAAGTAGRLWFTSDELLFYYDNGSSWQAPIVSAVTAAEVTHGTFGSATSDLGTYAFAAALTVAGDFAIATNKFTVASASGNTLVAGTLAVTGAATLSSTLAVTSTINSQTISASANFTGSVTVASGFTVSAGTSAVQALTATTGNFTGNFSVATNKMTVAAASGNTAIAGTILASGVATFGGTYAVYGLNLFAPTGSGNIAVIATHDFVATTTGSGITISTGASSGNTTTTINAFTSGGGSTGTLNLNLGGGLVALGGAATIATTLGVTGLVTLAAGITSTGPATFTRNNDVVTIERSDASAGIMGLIVGRRNGATKWYVGLNSSDEYVVLSSGGLVNLTITDAGAGTFRAGFTATTGTFSGSFVSIGTNPSTTGALRLANNTGQIIARNAANNADLEMLRLDASNTVNVAAGGAAITLTGAVTANSTLTVTGISSLNAALIVTNANANVTGNDQSFARVNIRNSTANRTWAVIAGQDGVANTSFQIKEMIGGVVIFQSDSAGAVNLQSLAVAGAVSTGALTATTITASGIIQSTITSGNVFAAASATTGALYQAMVNTGSNLVIGIESSTGGALLAGTAAYSGVIGTQTNQTFYLVTNGTIRGTITGAGATTFSGSLGVTGATAFSKEARLQNTTVAGLTAAATAGAGALAFVTDATTTAVLGLGLAVTGGGANKVIVYSDGANWIII